MDIHHTFEVYQKQLDNIRKTNGWGQPNVLAQYRVQFKAFSDNDIGILKSFLQDNDKKWFVAHLLEVLDSFPIDLLKPMLEAAVNEPDPSFNNEFIKPCRRVFANADIRTILLDIFLDGDIDDKIGVLKALYWARPTVYILNMHERDGVFEQKGYETFFWDHELKSFNEDFIKDNEVFEREYPRQEEIYRKQIEILIEEFYRTEDIELKYQIGLRLPSHLDKYPDGLEKLAEKFLKDKRKQSIPGNIQELDEYKKIRNSFLRKILLGIKRMLFKKRGIALKQR